MQPTLQKYVILLFPLLLEGKWILNPTFPLTSQCLLSMGFSLAFLWDFTVFQSLHSHYSCITLQWAFPHCPVSLLLSLFTVSQLLGLSLSFGCQSHSASCFILKSCNSNPLRCLVCWFCILSLSLFLAYCSALCIYSAFPLIMLLFKNCIRSEVSHIRFYQ